MSSRRRGARAPRAFLLNPAGHGEGRVRGAAEPVCGVTHLTLPSLSAGPLPLPPEGRRGAVVAGWKRGMARAHPFATSRSRGAWLIGSQPASVMIAVSPSDMLNPVSLLSRIMCRKNTMFGARTCGSPA